MKTFYWVQIHLCGELLSWVGSFVNRVVIKFLLHLHSKTKQRKKIRKFLECISYTVCSIHFIPVKCQYKQKSVRMTLFVWLQNVSYIQVVVPKRSMLLKGKQFPSNGLEVHLMQLLRMEGEYMKGTNFQVLNLGTGYAHMCTPGIQCQVWVHKYAWYSLTSKIWQSPLHGRLLDDQTFEV